MIDPKRIKKAEKLLKTKAFEANPTKAIWDELMSISERLDGIIKEEKQDN